MSDIDKIKIQKERQAQHARNYAVKNRDLINAKARANHHANRDAILEKRRARKVQCKLCHFDLCNVTYYKEHLINRHKLSPEDAVCIITG